MSRNARIGLAAATAAALLAAFPHRLGGAVVDAGWLLAWAVPALCVAALRGLPVRRAALVGLFIGWAAYASILHWIYVVTVVYGHAHPGVGVIAPVVLALYMALHLAAFAASSSWLAARGLSNAWVTAVVWAAFEHLRSFSFSGFPWATLGYAQHENPWMLGLAACVGVYGLSFVTALGSVAALEVVEAWRCGEGPRRSTLGALAAVGVALAVGAGVPTAPTGETVRVGVAQGNIDQGEKWSPSAIERTLARYEQLTRAAAEEGAELVVWPETAVPGPLELDPALRTRVGALARETRTALTVGGVGLELDDRGRPKRYFDSAFQFDPSGRLTDRYDKTHLVPFGEYIPFQELLGRVLSAVARGIASVGVAPGDAPRGSDIELPDGRKIRVGSVICYELLFPDLVRRFAADGGQVLLAITNDAWYGRTGAPHQFLAITALRAAETGLWVARAANTGVSGFIDGRGAVREATPIFESAHRVADVPLHPAPRTATLYVRFGHWFPQICWAALAGLAGVGWRRGSNPVRAGDE